MDECDLYIDTSGWSDFPAQSPLDSRTSPRKLTTMSIKKSEDIATNTSYVENKGPDDPVAALVIDLDEEKAVLRKIDRVVLPVMALVFFFQYLDKQGINYAAVFGLQQDLRLTGQQFSWSISLFYFGQLCSEYPAAYLMSRLSVVRFVAVTM